MAGVHCAFDLILRFRLVFVAFFLVRQGDSTHFLVSSSTALHDDGLTPGLGGPGGGPNPSLSGPSMGRITGSASIETLVRVGIEKENGLGPEAKMVVLHDFTPCVDDELEVKRGQVRSRARSRGRDRKDVCKMLALLKFLKF